MLKKARIIGGALLVSVILSALLGVVYLVLAQEGDPNLPPVVDLSADFALAAQLAETKDYAQAESIYREIIADYPGTDHAFAAQKGLALAAMARKDWDTAVSQADVLIAQYPTNPQLAQALYGIARQFDRGGKQRKAFRYYQACLEHNPSAELALEVKSKAVVFYAEAMDYATANSMLSDLKAALPAGEDLGKIICKVGRAISINAYNHKHANEEANNDAHRLALAYFQEAEQMFQEFVPTWRTEYRAIESRFGIINSLWALDLKRDCTKAENELMAEYACEEGGRSWPRYSELWRIVTARFPTIPGLCNCINML